MIPIFMQRLHVAVVSYPPAQRRAQRRYSEPLSRAQFDTEWLKSGMRAPRAEKRGPAT